MSLQPEACVGTGGSALAVHRCPERAAPVVRPQLNARTLAKVVDIQLADTLDRRESVRTLINRRYAWRGYGSHHVLPSHRESATFTASEDGTVLGTVTLVVDSAAGLAADATFADQLNPFRETAGRKICELGKLAFDAGMPSKPLLAALFHIVFIYGYHYHRCTDLFIEVNPRHRRFYEAMLGFTAIGAARTNPSVDAPAQLMWLEISSIRRRIEAAAPDLSDSMPRSLYALFFSYEDALELAEQLTSDRAERDARVKLFLPAV